LCCLVSLLMRGVHQDLGFSKTAAAVFVMEAPQGRFLSCNFMCVCCACVKHVVHVMCMLCMCQHARQGCSARIVIELFWTLHTTFGQPILSGCMLPCRGYYRSQHGSWGCCSNEADQGCLFLVRFWGWHFGCCQLLLAIIQACNFACELRCTTTPGALQVGQALTRVGPRPKP
jgi:hypothetical protein